MVFIVFAVEKSRVVRGEGVAQEFPVNWNKVVMFPSLLGLLPSQSGLPIVVAMKRPLIVSVNGRIGVEVIPPKHGAMMPTIIVKSNLNPTWVSLNLY